MTLLEIRQLTITIKGNAIVKNLSLTIHEDETVAIIGASGSGKSLTALTLMDLLPESAHVTGEVIFKGVNLLALTPLKRRRYLGLELGMVFQDSQSSLNPIMTVGYQLMEGLRCVLRMSKREANERALSLLQAVNLSKAKMNAYPFELSGGERQRVIIALALAYSPALLIADEPTTALDPNNQEAILTLLKTLQKESQMSMLFITHDLSVAREMADLIAVMDSSGEIVERGSPSTLFTSPKHPFTARLVKQAKALETMESETLHASLS